MGVQWRVILVILGKWMVMVNARLGQFNNELLANLRQNNTINIHTKTSIWTHDRKKKQSKNGVPLSTTFKVCI